MDSQAETAAMAAPSSPDVQSDDDLHYGVRHRLQADLEFFQSIFEKTAVGLAVVGPDGQFLRINPAFCEICGRSSDELRKLTFADITHPDDLEADVTLLSQLTAGKRDRYAMDKRYIRPDGSYVWINLTVSMLEANAYRPERYLAVIKNIEIEKRLEATRSLLVKELNHRVKNTLAVVQGIVQQTLITTSDPQAFAQALEPRLHAVAKGHDLLNETHWSELTFGQIIASNQSGAFAPYESRIRWQGDETKLAPQQGVLINLILYELTTNALKHGSLSNDGGVIDIQTNRVIINGNPHLKMHWRESGGPAVCEPSNKGFGLFVTSRGAAFTLNGTTNHKFNPDGFEFELCFPVETDDDVNTIRAPSK